MNLKKKKRKRKDDWSKLIRLVRGRTGRNRTFATWWQWWEVSRKAALGSSIDPQTIHKFPGCLWGGMWTHDYSAAKWQATRWRNRFPHPKNLKDHRIPIISSENDHDFGLGSNSDPVIPIYEMLIYPCLSLTCNTELIPHMVVVRLQWH